MRNSARRMAVCAMMAAVCVVLMLLGAVLELGIYACPMFAGLCFLPLGKSYGRKYHIMLYVTSALLCFMLVPNVEENLMFAAFFGWYPIVRPGLQKLPRVLRWVVKGAVFNAAVIAVEWLVMTVLAPEALGEVLLWVLLVLGNVTFVLYDLLIPKMEVLLGKLFRQKGAS